MKKNKSYYAIKSGRNVNDLIVDTWEECSKYVTDYTAVYKIFKKKKDAESYLTDMSQESLEIQLKTAEMQRIIDEIERLRPCFEPSTPDYILAEMARLKIEDKKDIKELGTAIAVATGHSITREEAQKIRATYVSLCLKK